MTDERAPMQDSWNRTQGESATRWVAIFCLLLGLSAGPRALPQAMVHSGIPDIENIEQVLPPVRGLLLSEEPHGVPNEGPVVPDQDSLNEVQLIATALSWLGTPYRAGGYSKSGVDCSGFLSNVLMTSMPEKAPFPRTSEDYAHWGYPTKVIEPGCILLFARNNVIYHVGIALSESTFIHAASEGARTGVIISSLFEGNWRSRLHSVRCLYPGSEIDAGQ